MGVAVVESGERYLYGDQLKGSISTGNLNIPRIAVWSHGPPETGESKCRIER